MEADVVIVGAGPAGTATAISLRRQFADLGWSDRRIVVVEKAVHPREKLCGGGITRFGDQMLDRLGLELPSIDVPVDTIRFRFGERGLLLHGDPVLRVVRRSEFDHWLVRTAREHGVVVREGEAVTGVEVHDDRVIVTTAHGSIEASVLVAADGSGGPVRRLLGFDAERPPARLLETLTAGAEGLMPTEQNGCGGLAEFDFSPFLRGLKGYAWHFPAAVDGEPFTSSGVFDSTATRKAGPRAGSVGIPLRPALNQVLEESGSETSGAHVRGFPLRMFERRGTFSRKRVLLAGDAAGADPLFAEGIPFALAYGEVAAATIADAWARDDFSFDGYRDRILAHPVLRLLKKRARVARWLYTLRGPLQLGVVSRMGHWLGYALSKFSRNVEMVRGGLVEGKR